MPTIIEQLADKLKQTRGLAFQLEYNAQAMLLTLTPAPGRRQVVKVALRDAVGPAPVVVTLVSRACPAKDYRTVREALKANIRRELGGLSIEDVDGSKIINVTLALVAEGIDFLEFLTALQAVARYADVIEHCMTGVDHY